MSILKTIGSYFVTTEADQPKQDKPQQQPTAAPAPVTSHYIPYAKVETPNGSATVVNSTVTITTPVTTVNVSDNILRQLLAELGKHSWSGFHYLAFRNSVETLKNHIPDQVKRIQAAFDMGKATVANASAVDLIATADKCIELLDKEVSEFNKELEQTMTVRVLGKEQEAQGITDSITALEKQMAAIQVQIEDLQRKHDTVRSEANHARTEISQTQKAFTDTMNALRSSITSDKEQIKSVLLPNGTTA